MQTLQESRDSITSIAVHPLQPEIVVGSVDGTVRTYDLRMGKRTEDVIAGKSNERYSKAESFGETDHDSRI
jgi:WD40 repeat protein